MPDLRCDDCRALLNGFVDRELSETDTQRVRDHLDTCGACAAEHDMLTQVSSRVRAALGRPTAPDVLRARIRGAIAQPETSAPQPRPRTSAWHLIAAGLLIATVSAGAGVYFGGGANRHERRVAEEVLSSHLRSLMPGHLTDVASTDLHNVKPWFNGRAAFSPVVPRLDSAGFPLVGGRVDYVGDRQVAAVVYGRRQHFINVFSWPAADEPSSPPQLTTQRGYHLVAWTESGVEYWAASDLSVDDLNTFVSLFRQEAAR